MIDESIMNLTSDQLIILNDLVSVAKEAKEASKTIYQAYKNAFGIEEESVTVWSDSYNAEYITHDGMWLARYLHQTYDVKCTPDEIYKLFRAEYLIKNNHAKETSPDGYLTEDGKLKQIAGYFRTFVKRAERKLAGE